MKIVITGATGFVGRALTRRLLLEGHEIVVLTRDPDRATRQLQYPVECIRWRPPEQALPPHALHGAQAVIHLAGASIAAGRWTAGRKALLRASRIDALRQIMDAVRAAGPAAPRVVISSSAIGYYGNRGDTPLDEQAPMGSDFLANLCADWEDALFAGALPGVRRVAVRTGLVLGQGGALEKLLPPFRLGLGGPLGNGRQVMSWIHLNDLVALYVDALRNPALEGPVNGVAPHPVSNREFTRTLGRVLRRPALLPVPGLALRLALGRMAGLLLEGQRVLPAAAQQAGFAFQHPTLEAALRDVLGENPHERVFAAEQWLPQPPQTVFPFFSDSANLQRITPAFLDFRVLRQSTPAMETGTLIDYRLKLNGLPLRWRTRIAEWQPPERFVDVQLKGPYAHWRHEHTFTPLQGGTLIGDRVRYRLPLGALGQAVMGWKVRRDVAAIFAHRQRVIAEVFGT